MITTLKQNLIAFACAILSGFTVQAQNFHMVKDVNDSKDGAPSNNGFPIDGNHNLPFAVLKNVAYFSANDGIHDNEVWRSDGTATGTYLLKDINDAAAYSYPSQLVASGNYVYFKGGDGIHGTELWRTDGTATGTVLVKDITAGTDDSRLNYSTDVNGTLFFADLTADGVELMKSTGTATGTVVVKDVTPGTGFSDVSYITNVNGKAFYYYRSGIDSLTGLYRSDGTAAGTMKLTVPDVSLNYNTSAAVGSKYFFIGNDREPWISNGTVTGTHLIKAINPNNYGSFPKSFTALNGIAYFSATDEIHGTELWRSDGTKAGTYLVKDINAGTNNSSLSLLTSVGNSLFFLVTDTSGNTNLWKSDGTGAGTILIKTFSTLVRSLANINGMLYFEGNSTARGYEMWRSDGTTAGTLLVKDIYNGAYSSFASGFTALNGKILFSAAAENTGSELWISDGTVGNASLLKDINQTSTSDGSSYWGITPFNNKTYFTAYTSQHTSELWVTNGKANNTKPVNVQTGSLFSLRTAISKFFTSSNRLYFEAGNLEYGNELWSTDGSTSTLVKDITPGREGTTFPEQYFPGNKKTFNSIDSTVLFVSGPNETELWKTTGQGAELLKEGSQISALTRNKKDIYFAINSGELWKTDGTIPNTVKLNNAHLPNSYGGIPSIISYKNKIYYRSADHAMWVTNGTDAGTAFFKNIDPQFDAPVNFVSATSVELNNFLFFAAGDGATGLEIWKTDGTANGTALLKDINIGSANAFTDEFRTGYFTKVSSGFYFLADDGIHGIELWKSDGTATGTVLVKDITQGNTSTQISSLTQVDNKLAFLVYDYTLQKEVLWQSDGSDAGTKPVNDANLANVTITEIFNNALAGYKGKLYFTAYTPLYGYELWTGTLPVDGKAASNNALLQVTNKALNIGVQPNPFTSNFNLKINNVDNDQQVRILVSDMHGVTMLSDQRNLNSGSNLLNYNTALWPAGVYIIKVILADGVTKEIKVVK